MKSIDSFAVVMPSINITYDSTHIRAEFELRESVIGRVVEIANYDSFSEGMADCAKLLCSDLHTVVDECFYSHGQ